MIVPMKKAGIVVQAKDAGGFIEHLRSLGVVHVEHQRPPEGGDVEACSADMELIESALLVLEEDIFAKKTKKAAPSAQEKDRSLSSKEEKGPSSLDWPLSSKEEKGPSSLDWPLSSKEEKGPSFLDWHRAALHVIDLGKRYQHLKEFSRNLLAQAAQWEEWGDFDPHQINALRQKGLLVRLYQVPVAETREFPRDVIVEILKVRQGTAYCAVVSREPVAISFKEVALPKMGLAAMRDRLTEDRRVMERLIKEGCDALCYGELFLQKRKSLEQKMEFVRAVAGMGEAGALTYLRGYVPFDEAGTVQDAARREGWGLLIEDPSPQDRVPTLIRNPKWVRMIAPLFRVIEVVPGYEEVDISLWVLIFLSVFFGMLIGDAGYGLIFLLMTGFFHRKFGRKTADHSVFVLSYIFSACAIVWGVLSGTYFGQAWLPEGVGPLVPALRDDVSLSSFCFFLGAAHLSIGHLWRAVLKWPSRTGLSDVGWISILWGAFFLARTLISGADFPGFAKWFFIAGPVLVVLFSSQERNFLKGCGTGLGNLLLNFVNSFTDVVSYIRLFAVGLATVAIADAFNSMAADVGFGSFVSAGIAAGILFLGHALNIVLGPMAVLVHGVRLNVLEFCNHVDVKWSGFTYRPLAEGVNSN